MYSSVKLSVKNHSSALSSGPQRACSASKLSRTTTPTLARMNQISARSNSRPARVSASKMMV